MDIFVWRLAFLLNEDCFKFFKLFVGCFPDLFKDILFYFWQTAKCFLVK